MLPLTWADLGIALVLIGLVAIVALFVNSENSKHD
jgi:hypothetical protein